MGNTDRPSTACPGVPILIVAIAILGVVGVGCKYNSRVGLEKTDGGFSADETDAGIEDNTWDASGGFPAGLRIADVDEVDLLFVVDNSNSMREEQTALAREVPRVVRILASGDLDGDGNQDFRPVRSMHVGVVSSDMGTGGFRVDTCDETDFGDDGILQTHGDTSTAGCMPTYPRFFEFDPASGISVDDFASDLVCVAQLGTGGCGFEQQLEATLKAVTPSDSSVTFGMFSAGHADTRNCIAPGDCFLRDNSVLGVVLITDEDDCSASDVELFNRSTTIYPGDLNLRCSTYGESALRPITRYVDGLLATRADPDLLIFAVIAGVPTDLVANPEAIDFDAILGDTRMTGVPDDEFCAPGESPPCAPTRLVPSCEDPDRGVAFPPRRIVELARALEVDRGSHGLVQSICQANLSPAFDAVIGEIAGVLGFGCYPNDLDEDADGTVNCTVVETLPSAGDVTTCAQLADAGRRRLRTETGVDGRAHEVCEVTQLACRTVGCGGQGWYYDDFSPSVRQRCGVSGQRIAFTPGAEPRPGTLVTLECP